MSNQYFQFKQFRVEQGRCAMKVTTDACIQGAWTPISDGVEHVLDIGTGSGLLALMLTQKNTDIFIDAIEFDKGAKEQAKENVAKSSWAERVNVIHGDVRTYPFTRKYDLIICNPPFFINSLLGDNAPKNIARHTLSLSYEELLVAVKNNLAEGGYLSILLPQGEYMLWKEFAAEAGLFEFSKLSIKHTAGAAVKRVVGLFSKKQSADMTETKLVIKDTEQNYSVAFIELLSPYYLNL